MIIVAMIACLAMSPSKAAEPPAKLAPLEPAKGCYLGAYIECDPVAQDCIPVFERVTGKRHASYFHYFFYGEPFPASWVAQMAAVGRMPHIAWEPNGGLGPVADNQYLRNWAEAAHRAGIPIFLRFASEMNGNWQAWCGHPRQYREKWRLVADVMHKVAPNVVMVWCPFCVPDETVDSFYPGDDVVDWVGVNIYTVVCHDGNPRQRAGEDPRDQLRPIYKRYAPRKPIAICEYAATHYCEGTRQKTTDFAVKNMRRIYQSLPEEFPRVRLIDWFSMDTYKQKIAHNDYAVTSDAKVLATYRELVASDYFLGEIPMPGAKLQDVPPAKPSTPPSASDAETAKRLLEEGMAAKKARDLDTAVTKLEEAVKLDPTGEDARWALAWTYAAKRDRAKALAQFQELVRSASKAQYQTEALEAIKRLWESG